MEKINENNWNFFLSSIEYFSTDRSTQEKITTKRKVKCLAEEFANKLLKEKCGTVKITFLNRDKHFDVSKNQTATPINKRTCSQRKPQTWPKSKNKTIDNVEEITRRLARCQLFPATSDSTKFQNGDDIIPEVLQTDTNEHVKKTSSQSANAIIPKVPPTDTNEHVKEPSVQNADDIIPEVHHTDTDEHVKETSAQRADDIIPEVSQTDTNVHVKETSVRNADAIMPEVPQIDTNENVNEASVQSADDIIPKVSQTDTNEHVKETSVRNADAIMPEVPQIDTNENVNEASAQSADDISLRSMKTPMYTEVPVDEIPFISEDIDIKRTRDTKKDIDKCCSSWDVSSIAKYFNFKDCVIDITLPNKLPSCKDILEMVQKDICLRLKIVKSIDLTATEKTSEFALLTQLKSIAITEAGSRLVLDPLLVSLCYILGLQFEVEKNINCNFLPNCTFDYCIRKGKRIIGCIEAKSVTGLSDKSVAQAIIELMILQTTVIATESAETEKVDISKSPFFAIVTDGHRFIYIELKGSSLGFEHDNDKIKIRKVTKEGDWEDILQLITFLVKGDKK